MEADRRKLPIGYLNYGYIATATPVPEPTITLLSLSLVLIGFRYGNNLEEKEIKKPRKGA